jgi:thiol-disulfide isomerase/thioredoxin/uncharacterized membrane protein YphA (DoxX/SURF4 family)
MALAIVVLRCVLALVLVAAAAGKLADRAGTVAALRGFGVPEAVLDAGALLLPLLEAVAAAALLVTPAARGGAIGALALLGAFVAAITWAMARGDAPDCHCFGQLHSEPAGPSTLVRNLLLAALATLVVIEAPGRSLGQLSGEDIAVLLLALLATVGAAASVTLWRENRLRRTAPVRRPRPMVDGLPPGTPAPDLELLTLEGETVSLRGLMSGVRPAALVQISPTCGPCRDFLPELTRWQSVLAHGVDVIAVSSGELEDNRAFAAEHGVHAMYVDSREALSAAFRVRPTPSAVLIDEKARIAAAPAAGAAAIEALIRLALEHRQTEADSPAISLGGAGPG